MECDECMAAATMVKQSRFFFVIYLLRVLYNHLKGTIVAHCHAPQRTPTLRYAVVYTIDHVSDMSIMCALINGIRVFVTQIILDNHTSARCLIACVLPSIQLANIGL